MTTIKRVAHGGQCGYWRNALQKCRRRTRTIVRVSQVWQQCGKSGYPSLPSLPHCHTEWQFRCAEHQKAKYLP